MKTTTRRFYRNLATGKSLVSFRVSVKETDLFIRAAADFTQEARELVLEARGEIESFAACHPGFLSTLEPWPRERIAPKVVREMIFAGQTARVGPMAAVAGAVAEHVGEGLLEFSKEVMVENGGDVFLKTKGPAVLGLFAGNSPFSLNLGVGVDGKNRPMGVCTSSGSVGHSISKGKADAVCIVSQSCALSDAAATAAANRIQKPGDIGAAVEWAKRIPGISGVVAVMGETLGAWGEIQVVRLAGARGKTKGAGG